MTAGSVTAFHTFKSSCSKISMTNCANDIQVARRPSKVEMGSSSYIVRIASLTWLINLHSTCLFSV